MRASPRKRRVSRSSWSSRRAGRKASAGSRGQPRDAAVEGEVEARVGEALAHHAVLELVEGDRLSAERDVLEEEEPGEVRNHPVEGGRRAHVPNARDRVVIEHDRDRPGVVGVQPVGQSVGRCGERVGLVVGARRGDADQVAIEIGAILLRARVVDPAVGIDVAREEPIEVVVGEGAAAQRGALPRRGGSGLVNGGTPRRQEECEHQGRPAGVSPPGDGRGIGSGHEGLRSGQESDVGGRPRFRSSGGAGASPPRREPSGWPR